MLQQDFDRIHHRSPARFAETQGMWEMISKKTKLIVKQFFFSSPGRQETCQQQKILFCISSPLSPVLSNHVKHKQREKNKQ